MDLYLARHGETPENVGAASVSDPDLTVVGRAQAAALGRRMAQEKLTAVFASPAIRAVRTAAAVIAQQKQARLSLQILPELAEFAFPPDFVMRPIEMLQTVCPIQTPVRPFVWTAETDTDVYARAQKALAVIRSQCAQADACVFVAAHGTFNSFLLQAAAGLPLQARFNFSEQNACLSLIRYTPEADGHTHIRVRYVNSVAHLPPELVTGR